MRIVELHPQPGWLLSIVADDSRVGSFDVTPYLHYEAFEELRNSGEFMKVINGGYFIEWACGADLSADTIEAQWQRVVRVLNPNTMLQSAIQTRSFPVRAVFDCRVH
jgi:hypothetical protein